MPTSTQQFYYAYLPGQLRLRGPIEQAFAALVYWCSRQEAHPIWAQIAAIEIGQELVAARRWIPQVLAHEPCGFPIRGIYFGLGEFQSEQIESADLYLGFFGQCDRTDRECQWLWQAPSFYPENARLRSTTLEAGGLLCKQARKQSGLSSNAYICFSVGFATLLLREILNAELFRSLGVSEPVGIVTGFDSGDLVRLGTLSSDGLSFYEGALVD